MQAKEAAAVYQTLNPLTKVASKKARVIPVYQWNSFEKIDAIKEGVSKEELENLKNGAELDYDTLAKLLNVAKATLHSKKGKAKFDQYISERIFLIADLYSYGYEVFGNRQKFNSWMKTENAALAGITPLNLVDTLYGVEEVKHLIGRIAYGVYS
jgi:putative toxin-antitoxin system antitoxin component (TIGR02293 family)